MLLSFLYPNFLWLLLVLPLVLALGWPGQNTPGRRQRWAGLTLRLVILLALIGGLAGAQLERPVETVTTVFVLDVSDSVSVTERARAETFLTQALAGKPADAQAAVILFGSDALVEQLPSLANAMPALSSRPVQSATNIENALRLALALLPNEGSRRIVLLSDGQETAGEMSRLAGLAAARQVEVSVVALGETNGSIQTEVLVEQVSAPAQARQGQSVPVEVVVVASRPGDTVLRLFADGRLVETRPVRLNAGRNRFSFTAPVAEPGFRRFRVELEAEADGRVQNNWGAAFTTVYGPPSLLLVEGTPGEGAALARALQAAGLRVTVVAPNAIPATLTALAAFEAILLANVPAEALSLETQARLVSFGRDLGHGLVMIGGPDSYGAGGYLRAPLAEALPVEMEIRNRSREPNLALVLAIDKSGSMGACHCDDPTSRQEQMSRVPSGLPKIDIAKEAVFQASAILGDLDYLGVVAFDSAARWALETAPRVDASTLEQSIGGLTANGQTNIFAGLTAAEEALRQTPARVKHVILLTDGWSTAGAYEAMLDRFNAAGITLSVVAAGGGSAGYLEQLAQAGGGKYYPATNMLAVPQIFLKETIRATGNHIIEEPFFPAPAGDGLTSPLLRGLDLEAAPPLLGYNGTTAKAAARVELFTPRGDPLLATWQYGLGRVVAWTSDLSGRWARPWLDWESFAPFSGQLVNWTLPRPAGDRLEARVAWAEGRVSLEASVRDQADQPANFLTVKAKILADDGQASEIDLVPVGPGRYRADLDLPDEGVYLAQITAFGPDGAGGAASMPVAGQTTGLVVPYSPEYGQLSADRPALAELAATTGGQLLSDPAAAFAPGAGAGRQAWPAWPLLLLLAALLFPLDVALRRLRWGRREWLQTGQWLSERGPGRRAQPAPVAAPPVLSDLFQARERARRRQANLGRPVGPPAEPASPSPVSPPELPSAPASPPEDTLSRLRAAKKRATSKSD